MSDFPAQMKAIEIRKDTETPYLALVKPLCRNMGRRMFWCA